MVEGGARSRAVSRRSCPRPSRVTLGVRVLVAQRGGRCPFGFGLPLELRGCAIAEMARVGRRKILPIAAVLTVGSSILRDAGLLS